MPTQNHLTKYVNVLHDIQRALWQAAADNLPPRVLIYRELQRRVDHTIYLSRTGRCNLTPGSRVTKGQAAWRVCRWLVEDERNYATFSAAFFRCAQALISRNIDPHTVQFAFTLGQKHWSSDAYQDNPVRFLDINFYFVMAEQRIFEAILDTILKPPAPRSHYIAEQFVRSPEAQKLLAVYTDLSPLRFHDVYDLSAIFDSINEQYFGGTIPKPIIAWTSRHNYRKVGSYNFTLNIILISKLLNDCRVPELAVRFVMYHEMLHIRHGVQSVNGRNISHTPAFLAEERLFAGYQEAENILRDLQKILGGK